MIKTEDTLIDPFLKESDGTETIPNNALLICSYELSVTIDSFEEEAYIRRDTHDELWVKSNFRTGCAYIIQREGSVDTACLRLLERLIRARLGFESPEAFIAPGLLDQNAYDKLVERIEHELKENRERAKSNKTNMIIAAEQLGLSPRPTGKTPDLWAANCPGTNHFLYINSKVDSFGCGWCKRKGDLDELRRFVEERKGDSMDSFQRWFSEKVTISKFPLLANIQTGMYDGFQWRINVSDIFRPEVDIAFSNKGVANYWFPLGESFGMALESLYGAMRIMWEAEKHDQSLLLHCHAGRNRSVMVADSYYFLRTQEHRQPDQPGLKYSQHSPNRLLLNSDDGQLPGIYKMEEFLDGCKESFDDSFSDGDRPIDWIKHQMHMRGSGFVE